MKNFSKITLAMMPALLVAACAKEGSSDSIQRAREQVKANGGNMTPQAPKEKEVYVPKEVPVPQEKIVYVPKEVPVVQKEIVYVPKEVPVVQEKIVYVPKEVPVVQEQTTLNDNYFKIVMSDKLMSFYEGETNSYKISLRVLDPEIQMKLTAKGLPAGAELKDVSNSKEPNTYELRWKPNFNTISYDEMPPKMYQATLVPVLVSAKSDKKAQAVRGLSLEKTMMFTLFRTQQKPAELVISGLPSDIQEGKSEEFSVVATMPGLDQQGSVKPTIQVFQETGSQVAGSEYVDMDGSRYVYVKNVEYMDNFKWKFNMAFDTETRPVEAQINKDGTLANTDFTQVRFGMRVFGSFNASPASMVRMKINRTAKAPAVETPAVETPVTVPELKQPVKKPATQPTKKTPPKKKAGK